SRCISVDLPEPDGPMTAVNWPAGRSSDTPRSACTAESPSPYVRVSAVAVTACATALGRADKGEVLRERGQIATASRATRPSAASRAPADSRALVACASRRPARPPDGRTDTDARTSLPPATSASSYATSNPTG